MIKINNLHKFFNKGRGNEIHVINDVSLELPKSGMVAIFGKSGCGKTTLLNVIGGLDKFHSGSISINGEKTTKNSDTIRNKHIGYIFQNYNLHKEETCAENVANALLLCGITDKKVIEERVNVALKCVSMDKYAKRTPDTLSGGQQQRIAIARAIVKNPSIILADEPTGNLDEANTVMIMDLLKEISKEHLVLLVTHEANLVDYYCDTVIELSDGKVMNVRNNQNATGFLAKDKNVIYLGEYAKNDLKDENVEVEYYGEKVDTPIKLKLVNKDGKLFLRVDSENVKIVDNSSEITFREGVFVENKEAEIKKEKLQMDLLPQIEGTRFGRLFDFQKSAKSGFKFIHKKKNGKNMLRRCMVLFSVVLVFMSAVFGTSLGDLIDISNSYNHNVFYVGIKNVGEYQAILAEKSNGNSGMDYVSVYADYGMPEGDYKTKFDPGIFESFRGYSFSEIYDSESIEANGALLGENLAKELPLVAGKNTDISKDEIIISTKTADMILENATYGYIKSYDDLLGLRGVLIKGYAKIVGVVEADESAIYIDDMRLADEFYLRFIYMVSRSKGVKVNVNDGECVVTVATKYDKAIPVVGATIKVNGKELKVSQVYIQAENYEAFLAQKGIKKQNESEYFTAILKETNPSLVPESVEYNNALEEIRNEKYGEYLEYYYSEGEDYLKTEYIVDDKPQLWTYFEKGVPYAKNTYLSNEYFIASEMKKLYGEYPTLEKISEISQIIENKNQDTAPELKDFWEIADERSASQYYGEYDEADIEDSSSQLNILVSKKDYLDIPYSVGDIDDVALFNGNSYEYKGAWGSGFEGGLFGGEYTTFVYDVYAMIHSDSPEKTLAYLQSKFDEDQLITPDSIFEESSEDKLKPIVSNLVAMGAILALLCVCMHFIMRSSLMSKIKEVGIYRAIGTSKKNIVYRFFVESLILAVFTIVLGYLATSAFIWVSLSISSTIEMFLFYPVWYALIVLVVLVGLCVVCGILPVLSLLRKTPSQILAQYDI